MSSVPVHDWLEPRLRALLAEGEAQGFAKDVLVAVATTIINTDYNNAVPDPTSADDGDPGEFPPPAAHDPDDALGGAVIGVHVSSGNTPRELRIDLPE